MKYREFTKKDIDNIFNNFSKNICKKMLFIRELIFQIAEEHDIIGEIEETLKWGNPSYLTNRPRSGTTIRLSDIPVLENKYAISVHCQTSLVYEFKEVFPSLEYDGNRSIILDVNKTFPTEAIKHFIYLALTYHYRKKHGIGV